MSGPRQTATERAATMARLLAQLETEGVRVQLNAAGDGVRLEAAAPPSAEVVRLARTHRAALLEALKGQDAAKAAALSPPGPAGVYSGPSTRPDRAAHSSFADQLDTLARTPGHCGLCARWQAHPEPLAHLGECSAGRRAHGWPDGNPAARVEIHWAHACAAWNGQGFRANTSGKQYGPLAERLAPGVTL